MATSLLLLIASTRLIAQQGPASAASDSYPHAAEPIGTVRQIYDAALSPELAVHTFRNIDRLFPTRRIPRSPNPLPLPAAAEPLMDVRFTDRGGST